MHTLRTCLRRPMTWMVVIEILLVAGLLLTAWRVWDDRQHPARAGATTMAPGVALPTPARSSRAPASTPPIVPSTSPSAAPPPRLDADFIRAQMQRLGHDESTVEHLQWQLVDTVMQWAHRYIDEVVVPSVEAAGKTR